MAPTNTFPSSRSLAMVVSTLCMLVCSCLACSEPEGGYRAPTLEYKMLYSDIVAYGMVNKSHVLAGSTTYSVDFELRCIFKGAPLDEMIRINRVGSVGGLCLTTNLTVGQSYIVYLKYDGKDGIVPVYKQDPGLNQYLDEVVVICDATVNYPNGYDENNNKEMCPEEYNYDDCVQRPVITTPHPSPPPPPGKNNNPQGQESGAPYKSVVSEDDDDDDDENSASILTMNIAVVGALFLSLLLL